MKKQTEIVKYIDDGYFIEVKKYSNGRVRAALMHVGDNFKMDYTEVAHKYYRDRNGNKRIDAVEYLVNYYNTEIK